MPSPAEKPTIVVDTREQLPYAFDESKCLTIRGTLSAGDYSLVGLEASVAVERKSLDDFVGTVIRGRGRFERELGRLVGYTFAAIVVEATPEDVVLHHYRACGVHPNSVLGSAYAIHVDFGVPVLWCGDRAHAALVTQGLLLRAWKRESDRAKQLQCLPIITVGSND